MSNPNVGKIYHFPELGPPDPAKSLWKVVFFHKHKDGPQRVMLHRLDGKDDCTCRWEDGRPVMNLIGEISTE